MEKKETGTKKTAKPVKKRTAKASVEKLKKPAKKAVFRAEKKTAKEAKAKKPVTAKGKTKKLGEILKRPEKKAAKGKVTKAVKEELKKIAVPKKKAPEIPQRTIKKAEEKTEVKTKGTYSAIAAKKRLPAEYGENRITLMIVDPWKLFSYWEVRPDTLAMMKGSLVLRVYDVTGIHFDGKNANVTFDLPVLERIGDSYIGVGPGKAFIVDIGVISFAGDFITISRSNKVATPSLKVAKEEGVLPQEMYETGPVVGYF